MLTLLWRDVTELARTILGRRDGDSVRARLFRSGAGTLGLTVASYLILFGTSISLARLLGAEGYGAYSYALSWAMVLGIPAGLGMNRVLIRTIATYSVLEKWGSIRAQLRWANLITATTSIGTVAIAAAGFWIFRGRLDAALLNSTLVALLFVPVAALMRVRQGALQGLHRVVLGQLPETLVTPLAFILFVLIAGYALGILRTPTDAAAFYVAAAFLGLVTASWLLRSVCPANVSTGTPVYDDAPSWLRSALYLTSVSAVAMVNSRADVLILGSVSGPEAVGIYNAAARGADLVSFVIGPVSTAIAPVIASLHASGNREALQNALTHSARIAMIGSIPIAAGLILLGDLYLGMYGSQFTAGRVVLTILCIGQLANAAMALAAQLLIMTGHDRSVAIAFSAGAVSNIVLNLVLVPHLGAMGAALATAGSTIIWNVLMTVLAYRQLGIHSSALGQIGIGTSNTSR